MKNLLLFCVLLLLFPGCKTSGTSYSFYTQESYITPGRQVIKSTGGTDQGKFSIDPNTVDDCDLDFVDVVRVGVGGTAVQSISVNVADVSDAPQIDLDADNSSGQPGADFAAMFVRNGGSVGIADGDATVEEVGEQIFDYFLEIASGRQSKSEALGFGDNEFIPWQIGAVM